MIRRTRTSERGLSQRAQGGKKKMSSVLKSVDRSWICIFIIEHKNVFCLLLLSRRKTRSPSPRRRSPVKRERKRSASRSPRRKPSPVGDSSPPPPLMQLPPKPLEQLVEPETTGRAMPEPVIQETSTTWCVEFFLCIKFYLGFKVSSYLFVILALV